MVLLICLLVANLCLLFWGLLFDLLYYWLIQYWVLCCLMITFVRCCGLTLGLRVVDVGLYAVFSGFGCLVVCFVIVVDF